MPSLELRWNPRAAYEDKRWVWFECLAFLVRQRRKHCHFMQLMDLWLTVPKCGVCAAAGPFPPRGPDIVPEDWENDLAMSTGETCLRRIRSVLREDTDFAIRCKDCGVELRPWQGDDVFVSSEHLEETYGISTETPNRHTPSKNTRALVYRLYGRTCFGCGSSDRSLHIDHIFPTSKGGDAAFRNLQPLCDYCGARKGQKSPESVDVHSDLYFGPYPPDSHEGLLW